MLETEQNAYHVRLEIKQFDAATGKRLSTPVLQKFEAKGFKALMPGLQRHGYTVDILYDPTKYNADRLKARRLVNDRMQEVRAEQAQKQKDAEREALKLAMRKEVIAELEAEAKAKKK